MGAHPSREVVGDFDDAKDCCLLGDIDEQVRRLADMAGWGADLEALVRNAP